MNKLLYSLGQYHCRKGVKSMFKIEVYLKGYGNQYDLEQRLDYGY